MGTWIYVGFVMLSLQGIYSLGAYTLNVPEGTGPPFWWVVLATVALNTIVSTLNHMARKSRAMPVDLPAAAKNWELLIGQSMAEEAFRFLTLIAIFAMIAGLNRLIHYSPSFKPPIWIGRLGWAGVTSGVVANLVFRQIHKTSEGKIHVFAPAVPGAIFTLALINWGPLAASALHIAYNACGKILADRSTPANKEETPTTSS
jgi:hypothetical protein